MDIVSHGLWGSLAFGRRNRRSFWLAFLFGIAPDLLSFGPFFATVFLGFRPWPHVSVEPATPLMPAYVNHLYNITHSLVVFALLFGLLTLIFRRPIWEFSAWGFHILFDIPTHSYRFFPTPFLWPVSTFQVSGWSWASPWIFFPNGILLVLLYVWFFSVKRLPPSHLPL